MDSTRKNRILQNKTRIYRNLIIFNIVSHNFLNVMAEKSNILIQKKQSFSGLVETYREISSRYIGMKHTTIMARVLDKYVKDTDCKKRLDEKLERGYEKEGSFITCPVKPKTKKKIEAFSGDRKMSSFVTHLLLKFLEINGLDANKVPEKETPIKLSYEHWFIEKP